MDGQAVRAAPQHYFDYSATGDDIAHEIYHQDAVLEFPPPGERFEGVENFRESAYSMDAWEAPEWRARWRAAPPRQDGEPASDPAADAGGA